MGATPIRTRPGPSGSSFGCRSTRRRDTQREPSSPHPVGGRRGGARRRLDADDRHRLLELVRKGRGMNAGQRDELRTILAKLGPREFAYATADAFSPVKLPRR